MQVLDQDAVDVVQAGLEDGQHAASPETLEGLAVLETRLDHVRLLGGRFALVDVSPQVAGMLKAVGRARLAH
jgi:hypothetical protein